MARLDAKQQSTQGNENERQRMERGSTSRGTAQSERPANWVHPARPPSRTQRSVAEPMFTQVAGGAGIVGGEALNVAWV